MLGRLPSSYIRFQRKQYANLEIVQTEKKGFGLRAGSDLKRQVVLMALPNLPRPLRS